MPFALAFATAASLQAMTPGNYVDYSMEQNRVTINGTGGIVRINWCTPEIVRVDFDSSGQFNPNCSLTSNDVSTNNFHDLLCSDFNNKVWSDVSYQFFGQTADLIEFRSSALRIVVQKSPIRFSFYRINGQLLTREIDGMNSSLRLPMLSLEQGADEHYFGWTNSEHALRVSSNHPDQGIYGTGETSMPCDKKGRKGGPATAPFIFSTRGYGVFILLDAGIWNSGGSYLDLSQAGKCIFSSTFTSAPAGRYISFYFMAGPTYRDFIDQYTLVTGRPWLVNKKYLGIAKVCYWCENCWNQLGSTSWCTINPCYVTADSFINWIGQHRSGGWPLDEMTLDIMSSNFPEAVTSSNPDALVPGLTRLLDYCTTNKIVFGSHADRTFSHFATETAVKTAVDHGFDVAWFDKTATIPHRDADKAFQTWVRGIPTTDKSRVMCRYGWEVMVGHALPYGHQGDFATENPGAAWRVFAENLEKSLAGHSVVGTDLGDDEWNIIGNTLRPRMNFHYVTHAGWGDVNRTPWRLGAEQQTSEKKFMGLHHRFLPYLFTYMALASTNGMPVWRHMVMNDQSNPALYSLDFQSYVGDWLIQAPYYPYGAPYCSNFLRSNIWLPAGTWYDFWDGTSHSGPKTINSYNCNPGTAKDRRLPLFVKAGAIIPLMPAMDYIGKIPEDPLTLAIWPAADSTTEFELWEDETPVKTKFRCAASAAQVAVSIPPYGGSVYSPATRKYLLEIHTAGKKPLKVARDNATTLLAELTTRAAFDAASEGWFYDTAMHGVCNVKTGGDARLGFSIIASYNGTVSVAPGMVTGGPVCINLRSARSIVEIIIPFNGDHAIELLNMRGQVVSVLRGNQPGHYCLPLDAKSGGMYIVRAILPNGKTLVQRLMTTH